MIWIAAAQAALPAASWLTLPPTPGAGLCAGLRCASTATQELMEQYGAHRALLYNIGQGSRDTGVRYKDVAGMDEIKRDISEVMKMVLGDTRYQDMGARPPRVGSGQLARIHQLLSMNALNCRMWLGCT